MIMKPHSQSHTLIMSQRPMVGLLAIMSQPLMLGLLPIMSQPPKMKKLLRCSQFAMRLIASAKKFLNILKLSMQCQTIVVLSMCLSTILMDQSLKK